MLVREKIVSLLNDISIPQLEEYISKYPYADIAHFALAIKKSDEKSIHHISLLTDAPGYVHFVLNQQPFAVTEIAGTSEVEHTPVESLNEPLEVITENEAKEESTIQKEFATIAAEIKEINSGNPIFRPRNEDDIAIPLAPYHTIDYFASLGIKNTVVEGKDKLSVQLKSFTSWLKSMRKIDAKVVENELIEEDATHKHIVNLAEVSLEKQEILTENMVDVLIKQGRTNDAIATLEKLSLQDPAKITYFAARIDKLKQDKL